MMLRHRHYIFGSGLPEKLRPSVRLEMLGAKQREKVLVAKIHMSAVGLNVMLVFRRSLNIHVAGIPLVTEGGHTVYSPVNKDSEFGFPVPLGNMIGRQGFPGVLIRAAGDHIVNSMKIFG